MGGWRDGRREGRGRSRRGGGEVGDVHRSPVREGDGTEAVWGHSHN